MAVTIEEEIDQATVLELRELVRTYWSLNHQHYAELQALRKCLEGTPRPVTDSALFETYPEIAKTAGALKEAIWDVYTSVHKLRHVVVSGGNLGIVAEAVADTSQAAQKVFDVYRNEGWSKVE